jgi:toxin ParE1/3/4
MIFKIGNEAENDLEKIWLYTFENWSIEQAERYLNLIFNEIEYLYINPNSGLDCGFIRKGYWKSKVKSYLIFYRLNTEQNELEVIRVLHEVMDIESHL